MSDLQLTFLLSGIALFLGIAAYSWSVANPKGVNKLRRPGQRHQRRDSRLSDLDSNPESDIGFDLPESRALTKRSKSKADRSAELESDVKSEQQKTEQQAHDRALGLDDLENEPSLRERVAAKRGVAAKFTELTRKPIQAAMDLGRSHNSAQGRSQSKARRSSTNPGHQQETADAARDHAEYQVRKQQANGSTNNTSMPLDEPLEKPDGADSKAGITTDLVARIGIKKPIEQQELMVLLREYDYKFHRKIHLYGLNQLTDIWCDLEQEQPSAQFVDLGLSIQLADRNGSMSSKEAHDFQQMTLAFTTRYDAPFEFSMDIDAALLQAQKLDKIGVRFDSMAVLNIVPKSREGFRVADVESCARDLIMLPDANGIFMKTAGQRNDLSVMYRLACSDGESSHGLTEVKGGHVFDLVFIMNVPATPVPEQVFQEMIDDANKLAIWLEGKVVDRTGRGLSQRSLNVLLTQVSQISAGLRSLGITPGDAVSKKLF